MIFEVLSPSMAEDNGDKLFAYKLIDTATAIVIVDPVGQRIDLERVAPDEWWHLILPPESGVTVRDPALTLTFAEIFAVN